MRTRNAEAPKSGATKKSPPIKKDAAAVAAATVKNTPAATKPAPKSASGVKATKSAGKQSTPKATPSTPTPNPTPELKAEETAAPAVKSPEKKPVVKAKSPMAGKASAGPKVEEAKPEDTKADDPAPNSDELDNKEDGLKVEAVSDMKEDPEGDTAENEEEADDEEPMEEDAEQIANEEVEGGEGEEGFEAPDDEELAGEEGERGEGEDATLGEEAEEEDGAKVEDEEQIEISDMAKARKIKKEQEIFVGGLDRDAVEEDLRKVFEKVGEVVEVRLHKDFATNKNKGFAFVKFADKEQASKAITELKSPVIRGKRCGIAPSEDNDTLFVGNICNTWTKEAVKRKLKDYGIDNVESVTLVADTQNEGLSRGFAFVEFPCHADAMLAYKRLQKPDAIFGHPERTAKVAFAEPLRDPDPEIMAQVKSVFIDGLPPYWDEDRVKEQFKGYGEIERVVLARNMMSARRKDFGFVNFTTHEEAVSCVEGVNNTELGDGKSKMKVRARLANPLPKTQAVKGGMSGGFRIGHSGFGFYSRFGRGFGRGRYSPNRAGFQGGRGFHLRGRGRGGRFPFAANNVESSHSEFHGRRPFGVRGGGRVASAGRRGAFDRGRGKAFQSRRQPFAPEENFGVPFNARHLGEDPYFYGDGGHGIKRSFSMMEHDSGYFEPGSRLRQRYDHLDSVPGRYQGSLGTTGLYSHDYYGSDYGGSTYSSLYGGEQSGGGYYY